MLNKNTHLAEKKHRLQTKWQQGMPFTKKNFKKCIEVTELMHKRISNKTSF